MTTAADNGTPATPPRALLAWRGAGLALVALHVGLAWLSRWFAYECPTPYRLTWVVVGLWVVAGAIWLWAVVRTVRLPDAERLLHWAVGIGVLLRAAMLVSEPFLEADFYRYLWDGGVTAHGRNPYRYAPAEAESPNTATRDVPVLHRLLAKQSRPVIDRVHYPDIRTIYPPVAQGLFALAHQILPWSLHGWRLVALVMDVATLALLLSLLRTLRLPSLWVVVYWWNPLVVKELVNTAHVDVAVLPFVVGALLLAARRRYTWAVVPLALGVGVKLWPVILLPLILRPLLARPGRLLGAVGLFAALVAAQCVPVYLGGLDRTSGFVAYGGHWEMNDALYVLLLWAAQALGGGHLAARVLAGALLAACVATLAWREPGDGADLCGRALLAVAALFIVSPTEFPWYYAWMVPLLAVRPRPSLLLFTVLLPLYYLRFPLKHAERAGLFDYGIVWLEHVPVWALLLREWLRSRRGGSGLLTAGQVA